MDRRPRAATLCHRMSCPSVAFAVALAVGLAVGLCFGWMLTPNGPAALLGPASAHTFTSKRGPAAHWPAADWPASTRDGAAPSGTAPPGSPRHGAARASEARDVASTRACTLALVLAVDVSGSVDREEYALQIGGLADAFRTEDIASAINAGGSTGIFVTLVQWSGATRHTQVVPWRFLTSEASTRAFADEIEQQARAFRIYATGIGEALAYAGSLFAGPPASCRRRIIDVSGDGPSNEGRAPGPTRSALNAAGITINGLAILESEPGLRTYYERNVIGGAAAFVITADRFEDYPAAIRRKLLREILPPITRRVRPRSRALR